MKDMIKRLLSTTFAVVMTVASFATLSPAIVSAAVDTCTWTGATDANWNTASNWSCSTDGSAVPGAGDSLVFDNSDLTSEERVLNNNISGGSFANITFTGDGDTTFEITGNAFTLTGNVIIDATIGGFHTIENDITVSGDKSISVASGHYLSLYGSLSGSGSITKNGEGSLALFGDNSEYTGNLVVNTGRLTLGAKGLSESSSAQVNNGADITLSDCDGNFQGNLVLSGASSRPTGDDPLPKLMIEATCKGGGMPSEVYGVKVTDSEITFPGNITFGSDVTFSASVGTVKFTGALSGNYKFILEPGEGVSIITASSNNNSAMPNGTYVAELLSKVLDNDLPESTVEIAGRTVVTINGKRSHVSVYSGGTLKGTGVIGNLYVGDKSYVAPGLSPGCLTTNNLSLYGTYQFEAKGKVACSGYDQIKVTGTVSLKTGVDDDPTQGILDVSFLENFNPEAGTTFTIIDNDGSDAVEGTFKGLAEGATFKGPNGSVLRISYVGGDGNDVVLTIVTAGTPNTGLNLIMNNPLVTLMASSVAAGTIMLISRRMKFAGIGVRRR